MNKVVTIFGGSAPQPGEAAYAQAELLGKTLATAGFAVATGGYIGVMEAASKGAKEVGGTAIGVTCDLIESWRPIAPNPYLTEQIRCTTLNERAQRLIHLGDALISMPGGIGTLSEIAQTWSFLQTGEIGPRPLIVVGEMWRLTLKQFIEAANGYMKPGDPALLQFANDAAAAANLVVDHFEKSGK